MLEALEEQVVLMRLLGESGDEASVTVQDRGGEQVRRAARHSVVAAGYGSG